MHSLLVSCKLVYSCGAGGGGGGGAQEDRRTGGEGKDGEEREVGRSRGKGVASKGVITAQDNTW